MTDPEIVSLYRKRDESAIQSQVLSKSIRASSTMAIFSWMNKPWDRDQTPCPKGWDTGVWSLSRLQLPSLLRDSLQLSRVAALRM